MREKKVNKNYSASESSELRERLSTAAPALNNKITERNITAVFFFYMYVNDPR